jgi:micrococcal nuclease
MVTAGLATAVRYPPDTAMAATLEAAQADAQAAGVGGWASVAPVQPQATAPGADCDPSYPDVCIPRGPPDLDCGDVVFRDFTVVGSDPHGFDGNGDGVGCES